MSCKRGKPYSQTYLKTIHNQLSAMFNHAIKYYDLQVNPAAKAGNMGKEEHKEMLFWTLEEYQKFSEAVMDKPMSFYAFEMLYWCGIREGELLALTAKDFDFKVRTVTINKSYQRLKGKDVITSPKTKKSNRTISMPQILCEEMQEYLDMFYSKADNERIFPITKHYLKHEMMRGSMTMAKTISHCHGKGSLTHNNRSFSAKNVDSSRTKDNIILIKQPIADAYDDLFGAAIERYNAKQKRSDRKIKCGYFEHVFKRSPAQTVVTSADKRKSFYEDVVQIGTKDDTGVGTAEAAVAAKCLTEYMNGFQERNPNFRVFNAVLHMDEATPHLHIDYIPVGHYKQGVDTQNGIAQALKEMGYGIGKDAISRWRESERSVLEKICNAHGIEIAAPEKSRGSLTVEQYKEYAELKAKADNQRQEVEHLDNEISSKNLILEWRQEAIERTEQDLDKLGAECIEKRSEVEQLESKLSEKQVALEQTSAAVSENQELIKQAAEKVSDLNDIDGIQIKKTLFGGNVTVSKTDFDNLSAMAKKQIAAESKERELTAEVAKLKKEKEELYSEYSTLRERVHNMWVERSSFSALQKELDALKQRYNKVIEFIENLGLKEKLEKFLKPVTHIKRGR